MYIESLTVKNLRCFREINDMTLLHPGRKKPRQAKRPKAGEVKKEEPALRNVNLLLGNNGTGKTTILKGIALALIAPVAQNAGLRPYNLVRRVFRVKKGRPPENAEIVAQVLLTSQDFGWRKSRNNVAAELFIRLFRSGDNDYIGDATPRSSRWAALDQDESPAFLVVGYGASRRMAPSKENISSRTREAHLRYQRVRSLFEEDFSLVPLSFWLPAYDHAGRRKQVIQLLDRLLGGEYKFDGQFRNGEYLFEREGARLPLPALSDGPRALIAWLSDLLFHVRNSVPHDKKLQEAEGVVMVDEIDLHLHPEWQRTIIKTLSEAFPNIQFIFTSHSPLVTGSLEWQNIWVMKDDLPIQLPEEPVYGLSADQILQSKYFNLSSTRPQEVVDKMIKLDAKAQQGDRRAAIEFMRRLAYGSEPQVLKA